jgi:DNA polymerase-3 subunit gamma/tau
VYLIDEVHMLSTHSFNALLKTLEEPPPHVKFLLATTDPQKLPVTVLSRCLQFNLKRLPVTQIAELMKQILTKESVPFDAGGVRLVAQAADGSMRDGLSLLDQLIAFGGGKVDEESTRAMLGTIARDHVEKLGELLAAGDASALLQYAKTLEQWSPDYAQVLDELASLLVRVATKQAVSDYDSEELFAPELIEKLSKTISPEDAQLYYQTAITGRRDLALAPEPRIGFEMTLLRMLVFRPSADTYTAPAATTPGAAPAPRVSGAAQARAAAAGASRGGDGAGSAARSGDMVGSARRADDGAPQARAAVGARAGVEVTPSMWGSILTQLDVSGLARQLANNCVLIGRKGALVRLGLDPRNNMMRAPAAVDKLSQALSKYFGEVVRIEFEAPIAGAETPAQAEKRAVVEELDSARQSLESDPAVRALRETFGATLLPDTVRPLK